MTLLRVFSENGEALSSHIDTAEITAELKELNVGFERWTATAELSANADQEEVLAAYRDDVDRISAEGGYQLVDVVRLRPDPDNEEWVATARAARQKFLNEHTHDEDEVRFFVEGRGCFYLHLGDKVYAVVCETGDLLSVPQGTTHWFDMGATPSFCAIRFFQEEDGWVGNFTGNDIATRIPYLDELLATA
ncbi:MAG: cupin [Micromonosporaceae bacterium]|nr:cupin [Micromonosporaceae bacterium]